jgi:putative ABC transport system ATP-binding protein
LKPLDAADERLRLADKPPAEPAGVLVDGLTVRYGDVVAVAGVTLHVPYGSMLAVSGPSGAGKTTLLWAMAGALRPDGGTVLLDGEAVGDRADSDGDRVVLIPQGNGLARMLTAYENIAVPLRAALSNPGNVDDHADIDAKDIARSVDDRVAQALAVVGLEQNADHLVEELSGGEQQRVAVARGLAMRGRVVLADEPTSELDGGNRELVLGLLRAEAQRGAAVVIATHDGDVAAEADAHAVMEDGHLDWPSEEHG